MVSKFDRQILAVKTEDFTSTLNEIITAGGFKAFVDGVGYEDLVNKSLTARRGDLEDDPTFKQLIPYLVLQDNSDNILYYIRNSKDSETRLHAKLSIGIGGHIEGSDIESPDETIEAGLKRELAEEFGSEVKLQDLKPVGLIYADVTSVDQVHLGILFIGKVESAEIHPDPSEISEAKFVTKAELQKLMASPDYDPETWSKIAWSYIQKPIL